MLLGQSIVASAQGGHLETKPLPPPGRTDTSDTGLQVQPPGLTPGTSQSDLRMDPLGLLWISTGGRPVVTPTTERGDSADGRLEALSLQLFKDVDDDDDGVSPFLPRKNSMKYFYISCTHCCAQHTGWRWCACDSHTNTCVCNEIQTHRYARSALSFSLSLTIATILLLSHLVG